LDGFLVFALVAFCAPASQEDERGLAAASERASIGYNLGILVFSGLTVL
jgi:hypothetical protein